MRINLTGGMELNKTLTKICGRCKIEKPVSEFYKSTRDGYRSRCMPCHAEDCKLYAETGYYQRPEVKKRRREDWHRPDEQAKNFARNCLGSAIRAGKISRQPCSICGEEQAEGHHEDYSQPLEVKWLCRPCHKKLHIGGDNEG